MLQDREPISAFASDEILAFASQDEAVKWLITAYLEQRKEIIRLNEEVSNLERLNDSRALDIAQDRQRLAKLERLPVKPGKKSDQRKKLLANALLSRQNQGMTFAEIGKFLELGSRRNGKNTREQNMTHFGKLLEADKKSFVVTPGRTNGGKLVKLTKIYYEHLLRGEP